MEKLPQSQDVPVEKLISVFDSTSASYKFLLFRSILKEVQRGKTTLRFEDLALQSISYAWYSIHFYKLSYGFSDRMSRWIQELDIKMTNRVLISDQSYDRIYDLLSELNDDPVIDLKKFIKEFQILVPYRLISPWFSEELRGKKDAQKNGIIKELSQREEYNSIYSIDDSGPFLKLLVSDKWANYLKRNYKIIEGWWRSNFIDYLQKNNPTVLSISTKLTPPESRNMNDIKKLYKDFYNNRGKGPVCFYTGKEIEESISHDHFLPWSFLGSDPIYNFVPTTREVNSSKSNCIPSKKYLDEFSKFQFEVFEFLKKVNKKSLLSSYANDLHIDLDSPQQVFDKKITSFYKPLFLTAESQGFHTNWKV